MKNLKTIIVVGIVFAVVLPVIAEAASRHGPQQAKTGPGAKTVDLRAIRAGQRSKAHRQVKRAQAQKNRLRQEIPDIQQQIAIAKNAEQSVHRRFANDGSSRAVGLMNRATLDRANLENQLGEAVRAYRQAKAGIREGRRVLRQERSTKAVALAEQKPRSEKAPSGMKVSFAPGTKLAGQTTGKVNRTRR